jgi:carboxymethylenebutenolidase
MCDELTISVSNSPSTSGEWSQADGAAAGVIEAMVELPAGDGVCEAFFVHPALGRHPGVIFWPDAVALREAKLAMARWLAAQGYAVLAVNQYYRHSRLPVDVGFDTWRSAEGLARVMPLLQALTPEAVSRDALAFIAFLDAQGAVDTARGIGTQGYCATGAVAMRTAAAAPLRVTAVASFHGGGLVSDQPDSPHLTMAETRAAYLIAIARDDDARSPGDRDVLVEAAGSAGRAAEVEVYAADHSWCVPDAPAYDADEADRAFARLLDLYAKL